jgi:hypothetical protein
MTQVKPVRRRRQGRIFPEFTIPAEELARLEAERKVHLQRYKEIFDRVSPELMEEHYNWFIIIEPNSGDYFFDLNEEVAVQKARQKHPSGILGIMRLNETGTCGRI